MSGLGPPGNILLQAQQPAAFLKVSWLGPHWDRKWVYNFNHWDSSAKNTIPSGNEIWLAGKSPIEFIAGEISELNGHVFQQCTFDARRVTLITRVTVMVFIN
jgi:hypothetical protein